MHSKIIRQRLYGKEFQQRLGCVPLSQTTKRTAIEGHIGNLHAALYQVGGIFFLWNSEEPHFFVRLQDVPGETFNGVAFIFLMPC